MKNKCKNCKKINALPGKYCEFCGRETGIRGKRYAAFRTLDHTSFQRTETHFPTGDESTPAYVYKKKKAPAVIAAILIVCLLAGSAFGGYYFGVWERLSARFIHTDPIVTEAFYRIADGRRISGSVINASAAKDAINQVKADFQIRDAEIELAENGSAVIDGDTYYRFSQVYETVPVFGHSMVVVADQDGNVYSVTGNFCPLSDISVTPSCPKAKAEKKLASFVRSQFSFAQDTYAVKDGALAIYAPNPEQASLAYRYEISGVSQEGNYECYEILLSAKNGSPLYWRDAQNYFTLSENSEAENPRTIEVEGSEEAYQFADTERNIQVYSPIGNDLKNLAVQNSTDDIDISVSFDALYNTAYIYDYYKNVLGLSSYDGQGGSVTLITNIPETNHTFDTASAFESSIAFFPVSSNQKSTASAMDAVGHEFTHLVCSHLVGQPTTKASESVFEAFCDIIGNAIEHKSGAEDPAWELGEVTGKAKYSMQSPSASGLPETVSAYSEEKLPQENASILAHAAYLMYEGSTTNGFQPADTAVSDFDLFGKLWYRAMLLLPEDADFDSAATALSEAAHTMFRNGQLSAAQLHGVHAALEAIGAEAVLPVYRTSENPTVSVIDSIGNSYQTGMLTVTDRVTLKEVLSVPIETDRTRLQLPSGNYLLTLSDRDAPDQNPIYRFHLEVSAPADETEEAFPAEFTLYTWYNAKNYLDVMPGGVITVTGKIVGEEWTNDAGETQMAWILVLDEPLSVRMITENLSVDQVYNDQIALCLISDYTDFSAHLGAEVTVSGILIQKYSEIHRRDLCLDKAYIGNADERPEESPADEEATEAPDEEAEE